MRSICWGVAAFCAIETWIAIMVAIVDDSSGGRPERAAVSFAVMMVLAIAGAVLAPKNDQSD